MEDSKDVDVEVQARLENVATGNEVAALVADPAIAQFLEANPQRQVVIRIFQLLAQSCATGESAARARSAAALASLWSLKPLRGLADKVAPRALSEPLPDLSKVLQPNERTFIALWLAGRRLPWVADFAARSAVAEATDDALCRAYTNLLFGATATVSAGLESISRAIAQAGPQCDTERTVVLCESLAASAQRIALPSGTNLASAFSALFQQHLLSADRDVHAAIRPKMGMAVARLAAAVISCAPAVLSSPAPSDAFIALSKWISAKDREWQRLKSKVIAQIGELTALFAAFGVKASMAAINAKRIEPEAGTFARLCRAIVESTDVPTEDVAAWLRRGGEDGETTATLGQTSEVEALANLMIRADELRSSVESRVPAERLGLEKAIVAEVMQLGERRGLELYGERLSSIAFDALRQRSVGSAVVGAPVRVLIPGVVRKTESGRFQIVQAVVEPVAGGRAN